MYTLVFALIVTLFVTLWIDKMVCSVRFNNWYNKKCLRSLKRLPEKQVETLKWWVEHHIQASTNVELGFKDFRNLLPIELRFRLKEARIRGLLYDCGYEVISNCFLDPACFLIEYVEEKGKDDNDDEVRAD